MQTIHFSARVRPGTAIFRLFIILAFILLSVWTIETVEPDVAYRRGRLILGDFGVSVVRLLMTACAAYFAYFGWVLIRNIMIGELFQVSDGCIKIGSLRGPLLVRFEELSTVQTKGHKPGFRRTSEAVDLIITDRLGTRITPKWMLYGSGVSVDELNRILKEIERRKP